MPTSLTLKTAKRCATCIYWSGSISECSKNSVRYDINQYASCLLKGSKTKAAMSCREYECRF